MSGDLPKGVAFGEACVAKSRGGRYGVFVPKKFDKGKPDHVHGVWESSGTKGVLHKSKLEDVQRRFPLTSKLNYLNESEYDLARVAFTEAVRKDFEKEIAQEDDSEGNEDRGSNEESEGSEAEDSSEEGTGTGTSRSPTPTPSQKRRVQELFSSSDEDDLKSRKRARRRNGTDKDEDVDVDMDEEQSQSESGSSSSQSDGSSSSDSNSDDGENSSSDDSVTFVETRMADKVVKEKLLDRQGLGPYYSDKYVQPVLVIVRENGGNPDELLQGWFIRIRTRTTSDNNLATDVSYLDEQGHVSKSRPEIVRSLGLISSREAQNEAVAIVAKLTTNIDFDKKMNEIVVSTEQTSDEETSEVESSSEDENGSGSDSSDVEMYECEQDCGFAHKKRSVVERHEKSCGKNGKAKAKSKKKTKRVEPMLRMPLLQGTSNELTIKRIGFVTAQKEYCCVTNGVHVVYPIGFKSTRLFLNQKGESHVYTNEIEEGPLFTISNASGEVVASGNSPLIAWRKLVDRLFDHFYSVTHGMEVAISMSESNAAANKAKRAIAAKTKKSPDGAVESPPPLQKVEVAYIRFEYGKCKDGKVGVEVEPRRGDNGSRIIITTMDGNVGSPPCRIGDEVVSVKVDGRRKVSVTTPDEFEASLEDWEESVTLEVRRNRGKSATDKMSLSVLKRVKNDLSAANEHLAFQFSCCLFGLVEASNRVRLLCEAMPACIHMPGYKFYMQNSKVARTLLSRKINTFEAIIGASIKTLPKGLRNLDRRYGISNRVHMRAEDVLSGKYRLTMRKSDQLEVWMRAMKLLLPDILQRDLEELSEFEEKQRNAIIRFFQMPCSALHKQLTGRRGFSLEPFYAWNNGNDVDDEEKVRQVLDMSIARIEISSWKVAHQGALRRGIEKFGARLDELIASNTDDGKTLRLYGYTTLSLLARCASHEIKSAGLNYKTGNQKLAIDDKMSVIKRNKNQMRVLSKRAARIVRGVLNRLVNTVVKDYRKWRVQQRRLRMAAVRRTKKETKFPDSVDFTPHEYATLCAGVECHGKDWKEILLNPVYAKCFRPHHQSARSLARAWSDLRSVMSVRGKHDMLYPLMGYYVRLTEKASKRRGDDDTDFAIAHTFNKKGKKLTGLMIRTFKAFLLVEDDIDHEYVFVGKGCDELVAHKLALSVSLKRSVANDSNWAIGPTDKGMICWIYSKDDQVYSYYPAAAKWIKNDGTFSCTQIKTPDEEEEDEEDTEILTDEQVVKRIKHVIQKRKLLERRQTRLEKRLNNLSILADCDQDYLMTGVAQQNTPQIQQLDTNASPAANGSIVQPKRLRDGVTNENPPTPKHFKENPEAEEALAEDLDNILEEF